MEPAKSQKLKNNLTSAAGLLYNPIYAPKYSTLLAMLVMAVAAPLAAQQLEPAPSFGISANPNCGALEPTEFTCLASGNLVTSFVVPSGVDLYGCTLGGNCHYEYCVAAPATLNSNQTIASGCNWNNSAPTTFNIIVTGSGSYTAYAEYRLVIPPSTFYYSTATGLPITLDAASPSVVLNSPAYLPNQNFTGNAQPLQVNGAANQWITWWATTTESNDAVSMTLYGCPTSGCSTLVDSGLTSPPTFSWLWPGPIAASTSTYLELYGVDYAGGSDDVEDIAYAFTVFDPTTGTAGGVTCGPVGQGDNTQPCLVLADGDPSNPVDNDIPGDPPAGDPQPQAGNNQGILFSGYSDPCIRADTVVSPDNPFGNNLYMTYSYALLNSSCAYQQGGGCTGTFYSQAVEIHLGYSPTGLSTSSPGGQSWCAGAAGDQTQCGTQTILFPSLNIGTTSAPVFTSHEVSNFWEVPNYNNTGYTLWVAVQLTYWIQPPQDIPASIMNTNNPGCLVVNWGEGNSTNPYITPAALAWPSQASSQPSSCTGTNGISGSLGVPLTFSNLNNWVHQSTGTNPACASWGQPAIMLTNQITPSGGTPGDYYIYLAAACLDRFFNVSSYYVLYTDFTASQALTSWNVSAGPFNSGSLTALSGLPSYNGLQYITELEWFIRPAASGETPQVAAIFTPVTQSGQGQPTFENGCLVANFNPVAGQSTATNPVNPFVVGVTNTGIIANIFDMDTPSSGPTEKPGPGSCAYDPMSNTGVVEVRRLVTTPTGCMQGNGGPAACPYNIYTLVDSGVMP